MEGVSPKDVDILKALSDSKSLEIFRSIAKGNVGNEELKRGLSTKQYYFRMRQLLKAGLVQRIKGRFSFTCLGAVVYHAQLVIKTGVNNYWKLKAIDSIQASGEIIEQERLKIIKTILDNNTVQNILIMEK
jgi:DNA-binding transcriptional ArsR family regulator